MKRVILIFTTVLLLSQQVFPGVHGLDHIGDDDWAHLFTAGYADQVLKGLGLGVLERGFIIYVASHMKEAYDRNNGHHYSTGDVDWGMRGFAMSVSVDFILGVFDGQSTDN